MKRKFLTGFLATLSLIAGVTSCNQEETDDYQFIPSSECIVTSVVMGNLKCALHTKSSKGEDSIYYVSVVGAGYPMSIDQKNLRIFNVDSLPAGTDVSKMVFSYINTIGSYTIVSEHTGKDTTFVLKDSTDFRNPRIITVHASDGESKRQYKMTINVHKEVGDSMVWRKMAVAANNFSALENTRSFVKDQQLFVFGTSNGTTQLCTTQSENHTVSASNQWTTSEVSTSILPQSVVRFNEQFYAVNAAQHLFASNDGVNWTALATDFTASTLVVSGTKHLIALKDGQFYSSTNGTDWTANEADDTEMLPESLATGTCLASNIDRSFETLVVVGRCKGKNVVWKREIDLTGKEQFPWIYVPETPTSKFNIPDIHQISVSTYDGNTLMSGLTADGKISPLYVSRDHGRTWKNDELLSPEANGSTALSTTIDEKNFIWMFCGDSGELWRGRINRLGWDKIPGAFERSMK